MSDTTFDALTQQREELVNDMVRELKNFLSTQFVTRTEVKETLLDTITDTLNSRLDTIEEDSLKRHVEMVRQFESRFEQTATKEELAGVTKSGAENTERISKLESSSHTQIAALEKRLDKVEDIQRKQTENIQTMTTNTDSIRQSVQTMQNTVLEEIERDKKRQLEVDRQITGLHDADTEQTRQINQIASTQDKDRDLIRGVQQEVGNIWSDLSDQRARIVETLAPMQQAVKDIPGMNQRVTRIESGLSVAIFFLSNPVGRFFLAMLILAMVQRPDIIGAVLPIFNQK